MLELLKRLKPYKASVVVTLLLILIQALAELGLPTLMAGIIDKGVLGKDSAAVVSGGLWMFLVATVGALASVAAAWVSSGLAAGYGRDLRSAVFHRTTGLTVDQFSIFGAATLITRTTNDVTQVQSFVIMSLRMLASAPLMALGGIVLAFTLDPGLATVLVVVIPVVGAAIVLLARRGVTYFRLVQQKIDRLNLVLRESLTGVRVIRAFDRQNFDAKRFDRANLDLAEVSLKTQKLMSIVMPSMLFAMSLTSVLLVWFGGLRIEAGTLKIGGLMAFLQYATQILFSLMMLSMLFVLLPRAAVSAGRINEVLQLPVSEGIAQQGASEEPVPKTAAEIEFRNVSFRYPGAQTAALENVSFRILPGQTAALIGGTGSGKSTIVQLIARFHDASSGSVLVDGLDVKDWSRAALRHRLGLSPQKARLFTGTVEENLRWGKPNADGQELLWSLETAQARDFVDASGGLTGKIDQAGANLSGGQKQRLAIARALVRRPAALLFDDSFSALDAGTDAALRSALAKRLPEATLLLVAQRVSTVRQANFIVVLDEGRVVGTGTHETLLSTCPVYREIVVSQESLEERP